VDGVDVRGLIRRSSLLLARLSVRLRVTLMHADYAIRVNEFLAGFMANALFYRDCFNLAGNEQN
jgi:hypothetical protein